MPSVKRTRLRSSGTLPMFAKPEKTLIWPPSCSQSGRGRRAEEEGLAPRLRDLVGSRAGEGVRADGDRLGEVAVTEDLDPVAFPLDEAAIAERRLVDLRTGGEDLEVADVDALGGGREGVVEAALREAALDRGLPAFEVELEAARARVLALLSAAGCL